MNTTWQAGPMSKEAAVLEHIRIPVVGGMPFAFTGERALSLDVEDDNGSETTYSLDLYLNETGTPTIIISRRSLQEAPMAIAAFEAGAISDVRERLAQIDPAEHEPIDIERLRRQPIEAFLGAVNSVLERRNRARRLFGALCDAAFAPAS